MGGETVETMDVTVVMVPEKAVERIIERLRLLTEVDAGEHAAIADEMEGWL